MVARRSATARSNSLATPTLLIIDGSGPGIAMEPSWRAVSAAAASAVDASRRHICRSSIGAHRRRRRWRRVVGPGVDPIATRGRLAPLPLNAAPARRVGGIPASARTSADPARRRVPPHAPRRVRGARRDSLSLCAGGLFGGGRRRSACPAAARRGARHRVRTIGVSGASAGAGGAARAGRCIPTSMRSRTRRASRRSALSRWAAGIDAVSRRDVVCCAAPPRPALRCAAIIRADSLLRPSRRATRVARGESSSASATARTPRWPGALRLSGCRHALTTLPEPASGVRGRSRRGPPQRRRRRRRGDVPAGAARARAHTHQQAQTQTRAHADSRRALSA